MRRRKLLGSVAAGVVPLVAASFARRFGASLLTDSASFLFFGSVLILAGIIPFGRMSSVQPARSAVVRRCRSSWTWVRMTQRFSTASQAAKVCANWRPQWISQKQRFGCGLSHRLPGRWPAGRKLEAPYDEELGAYFAWTGSQAERDYSGSPIVGTRC